MAFSPLRFVASLALWALLYYATGYLSLSLDDPSTRVAFVWLPAGVAVSAFLLTSRKRWTILIAVLVLARILLDMESRHQFSTSLALTCISLASDLITAWFVRRYARRHDNLHTVLVLIGATLGVSAISAVLGVGWLWYANAVPFQDTVWVWWAANITGVLLGTTLVMSWMDFYSPRRRLGTRAMAAGLIAWALLCASALYVFGVASPAQNGSAMAFGLACVPIALTVVVCIAWGNRGGAIALLSLGAIAVYYASDERGPFFPKGLRPGESLLIAQCYLSAAALLLAFMWILMGISRKDARHNKVARGRYMYRLDPRSGHLSWDRDAHDALDLDAASMTAAEDILSRVHPSDQAAFKDRWSENPAGDSAAATFAFRLSRRDGLWTHIVDKNPVAMASDDGIAIVGTWLVRKEGGWR